MYASLLTRQTFYTMFWEQKLSARYICRSKTNSNDHFFRSLFKHDSAEVFPRLTTVDETWIRHYIPETKQQSKQWMEADETATRKASTVPFAGKVMAIAFLYSPSVVLRKGRGIRLNYWTNWTPWRTLQNASICALFARLLCQAGNFSNHPSLLILFNLEIIIISTRSCDTFLYKLRWNYALIIPKH